VFGVIAPIWPGISLVALTALFGAFALVYGAVAVASGLNLLAPRAPTGCHSSSVASSV
jgi:uncharacterized membrane protein HdeD (DUF308 family)